MGQRQGNVAVGKVVIELGQGCVGTCGQSHKGVCANVCLNKWGK